MLFMIASREANKGRTYGFGSLLENSVLPTTTNRRAIPSNYSSFSATSASTVYTKEEVERLLEEREQKYAEERAKERADQESKEAERDARNQLMFNQIFATMSQTMPMQNMLNTQTMPMQNMLNTLTNMPTFNMPTNIMQHRSFAVPPIGNTPQGPTHEEDLSAASTSTLREQASVGEYTALITKASCEQTEYLHGYENLS